MKLVAATRSPSRTVVSLMAPRCSTASSSGPALQKSSISSGGSRPAMGCLARLRHLSSVPSRSTTITSAPRAHSAATRLEPMKPAPPVTRYIGAIPSLEQVAAGRERPGA